MCIPKFIEHQWIVPGQEPIIDDETEDFCYGKFEEMTKTLFDLYFRLLWFQCCNEAVLSKSKTLWILMSELDHLNRLPKTKSIEDKMFYVFQRMGTFKGQTPNPNVKYQADLTKTKIIFEVTLEKIQYQNASWEQKLQDLTKEFNRISEQLEMEYDHHHHYLEEFRSLENSASQMMESFHLSNNLSNMIVDFHIWCLFDYLCYKKTKIMFRFFIIFLIGL